MSVFGLPRRIRTAVEVRKFHARARIEFEGQQFVSDLLARDPSLSEAGRLTPFEQRVFSQNGEDGVLAEIFRRIGTTNRSFVEFGCGNGIENNSLYLLHCGWSGLWIDGDRRLTRAIAKSHAGLIDEGRLKVVEALVTAETIESIFDENGVSPHPDMVSIDIDGNDYWVWEALEAYRPRVLVVEYNALWPPDSRWVQAYAPEQTWDGTTHHGASIGALVALGARKGYRLVHCELSGVNAFFVREDEAGDHFCQDATAMAHYQPARYHLTSTVARPRSVGAFEIV